MNIKFYKGEIYFLNFGFVKKKKATVEMINISIFLTLIVANRISAVL